MFDGRVVEDFKLLTGTFVSVGNLRIAALAAASPLLMDAVVCGHDRDYVALLAWPNSARRRRSPASRTRRPRSSCARAKLAEFVRERFLAYNRSNPASSTRVERVILLAEPPSLDANEITDKGYVNQRAALERRAVHVAALFAEAPGAGGDHLPVGMPDVGGEDVVAEADCLDGVLGFEVVSIGDGRGRRALPDHRPRAPALRARARRRLRGAGRDARHRGDRRRRPPGRVRRDGDLERHELPARRRAASGSPRAAARATAGARRGCGRSTTPTARTGCGRRAG